MSLKLSKNRVNFLTKLIVDFIQNSEDVDYNGRYRQYPL